MAITSSKVNSSYYQQSSTYVPQANNWSTSGQSTIIPISGYSGTIYTYCAEIYINTDITSNLNIYFKGVWGKNNNPQGNADWSEQNPTSAYLYTIDTGTLTKLSISGNYVTWNKPDRNHCLFIYWHRSSSYTYANSQTYQIRFSKDWAGGSFTLSYNFWVSYGTETTFPTVSTTNTINTTSMTNLKTYLQDQAYLRCNAIAINYVSSLYQNSIIVPSNKKLERTDWTTYVNAYNKFEGITSKSVPSTNVVADDAYFNDFQLT